MDNENLISEIAAISGISTNFSSGDSGDFALRLYPSDGDLSCVFSVGDLRRRYYSGAESR